MPSSLRCYSTPVVLQASHRTPATSSDCLVSCRRPAWGIAVGQARSFPRAGMCACYGSPFPVPARKAAPATSEKLVQCSFTPGRNSKKEKTVYCCWQRQDSNPTADCNAKRPLDRHCLAHFHETAATSRYAINKQASGDAVDMLLCSPLACRSCHAYQQHLSRFSLIACQALLKTCLAGPRCSSKANLTLSRGQSAGSET